VASFDAATDWYARLFGRQADIVVKADGHVLSFIQVTASPR
jgi:hypothetical protein